MKKLLAALVAALFAAGAFARAPEAVVVVPSHSVHAVHTIHSGKRVVQHHHRQVKHVVHRHPRHRAPVRHRM